MDTPREVHVAGLNAVLGDTKALKKARMRKVQRTKAEPRAACSGIKWGEIEAFYDPMISSTIDAFPASEIRKTRLSSLDRELRMALACMPPVEIRNEADRSFLIGIVLHNVCSWLDDELIIYREMPVVSPSICATGIADFLVKKGSRNVLIVEAKASNIDQGDSQALVMMDIALALNEEIGLPSTSILGVVNTFEEWMFYTRCDEPILCGEVEIEDASRFDGFVTRAACVLHAMIKGELARPTASKRPRGSRKRIAPASARTGS